MLTLRRSGDRGHADHGWLQSRHSFSFAGYHDPAHMGWGNLRVINEDRVAPGCGFGTHGHRDMEIISYVLSGALAHRDSMGNGTEILPGDVQRMSAGTGVRHSEFNHSREATTHFLQIWILPERAGIAPGYEQKHFSAESKRGRLVPVASRDGADGAVTIHADAAIHAADLTLVKSDLAGVADESVPRHRDAGLCGLRGLRRRPPRRGGGVCGGRCLRGGGGSGVGSG